MKVSEAMLSTIWCPASSFTPSLPAISVAIWKAQTSRPTCSPTGSPSASTRRSPAGESAARLHGRQAPSCRRSPSVSQTSAASASARVRLVAIPAPTTPRAGAPRWPKISTQLPKMWTMFAKTITQSAGFMIARPWR